VAVLVAKFCEDQGLAGKTQEVYKNQLKRDVRLPWRQKEPEWYDNLLTFYQYAGKATSDKQ